MTKPIDRATGKLPLSSELPLSGMDILLLEDDSLVAFDAEDVLLANGAMSVEIASSVSTARDILAKRQFAAVVLDVKLTDGSSLELLPVLRARGIGAVIATGYPGLEIADLPILQKPYTSVQLIEAVLSVAGEN